MNLLVTNLYFTSVICTESMDSCESSELKVELTLANSEMVGKNRVKATKDLQRWLQS